MPITHKTGPSDGLTVIAQSLKSRGTSVADLLPSDKIPDIGAPLQMYVLHMNADRQDKTVSQAAATLNWYYPLTGGKKPGIAHVKARYIEADVAGSVVHSLLPAAEAARLLAAQRLAAQELGASVTHYQPRLLEISALRPKFGITALWLSGQQDYFIPLSGASGPVNAPLSLIKDIHPLVQAAAKAAPQPFTAESVVLHTAKAGPKAPPTPKKPRRKRGSAPS